MYSPYCLTQVKRLHFIAVLRSRPPMPRFATVAVVSPRLSLLLLSNCILTDIYRTRFNVIFSRAFIHRLPLSRRVGSRVSALVRFVAHGLEEKMALLPNLFYIKGREVNWRGKASSIIYSSSLQCPVV